MADASGNRTPIYEDITISTAGGTYATGGIVLKATKVAQILEGSLTVTCLGSGYIAAPVSGGEVAGAPSATVQFFEPGGASAAMVEVPNNATVLIGTKVRLSYLGV